MVTPKIAKKPPNQHLQKTPAMTASYHASVNRAGGFLRRTVSAVKFIAMPTMNSKLIAALTIFTFLWTSSVYADPEPPGRSSDNKGTREERRKGDGDLVHRLVQIARERYEAGNLKAADKILQAALEVEPRNKEAWYYSDLVQKATRANKNRRDVRLWYPIVPPRPAGQ